MLCPALTYTYRNGHLEIAKNVIFSSNSYMEISKYIYKVKHFKKKKKVGIKKNPLGTENIQKCVRTRSCNFHSFMYYIRKNEYTSHCVHKLFACTCTWLAAWRQSPITKGIATLRWCVRRNEKYDNASIFLALQLTFPMCAATFVPR